MNSQTTTKTARTQSRNAGSLTGSHGSSRSARKNRVRRTGRPRESYSTIGTRTAAAGLSPASASWSPYRAERSSELRCGRASGTPPVYPPTGEFQLPDAGAVRREARCRGSRLDRSGRRRGIRGRRPDRARGSRPCAGARDRAADPGPRGPGSRRGSRHRLPRHAPQPVRGPDVPRLPPVGPPGRNVRDAPRRARGCRHPLRQDAHGAGGLHRPPRRDALEMRMKGAP
jgi:hypothetical protein